jgi:hypothetical protein
VIGVPAEAVILGVGEGPLALEAVALAELPDRTAQTMTSRMRTIGALVGAPETIEPESISALN